MTPARLTLVNTRTIRGLALVPDTLDGRRSQDRTDTCLDHCETDQGSTCLTSHSAADEAGRGLDPQFASNRPFRPPVVTFDFVRIPTLAAIHHGMDEY